MENDMPNIAEEYLKWLDEIAGDDGKIYGITDKDEGPQIFVAIFDDLPETNHTTSYSFGLSSAEHPEWKYSRPELIISVHSMDNSWGLAMGEIIKLNRVNSTFEYGTIFNFGEQISDDSDMSAFFVFANSLYDEGEDTIELTDRKIQLSQLYPIYREEIDIIKKIGAEFFFSKPEIDFYDVKREMFIL